MEACSGITVTFSILIRINADYEPQNLAFAKDEAKFAAKRINKKLTGGLTGREPDIETETG